MSSKKRNFYLRYAALGGRLALSRTDEITEHSEEWAECVFLDSSSTEEKILFVLSGLLYDRLAHACSPTDAENYENRWYRFTDRLDDRVSYLDRMLPTDIPPRLRRTLIDKVYSKSFEDHHAYATGRTPLMPNIYFYPPSKRAKCYAEFEKLPLEIKALFKLD